MRFDFRLSLVVLLVGFAVVPVLAQERYPVALGAGLRSNIGIIDFDDVGVLSAMAPEIYVTLNATERVMVEPSVGLFRYSFDNGDGPFTSEGSGMLLRLGFGVFFASDAGDRGRVYYGPQVGVARFSSEITMRDFDGTETTDSETRMDLVLGGVAGGEFFLVDRLSLGGEVGLEWTKEGNEGDDDESEASYLASTAEVKVRWYIR